ncbi:MAG: TatD family hydrolase [Bacteroidetes bacterium]|nr:TatD family hydrolase [Bacteroidota bacterium]
MYIDTHAHIYLEAFSEDLPDVMDRSRDSGVSRIYLPNIDHTSIDLMLEVEEQFPGECIAMIGLHPCSVNNGFEKELYLVEEWLGQRKFAGIGEIGTDLHWDKTFWKEQQEALKIQLNWAKVFNIPAILHCRNSIDETIEIVAQTKDQNLKGIFHCFTGNVEQARKIVELGFILGIGGVSTFKNGGLEDVIAEVNLDFMVLETDSPYLSPEPFRGKRNEPSHIPLIAEKIAKIRNISVMEVAQKTTVTAENIFKYVSI